MARKRAPGGGRKPKGATAMRSQLTVRMPDDMRAELEAAARRRDHTISDELLWRLRASFARDYEERRDPAILALTFLIARLAEYIHLRLPFPMKWHENPFMFQAFKLGITKVLDAFAPSGEIESPYKDNPEASAGRRQNLQRLADTRRTPEDAAQAAADRVLELLFEPQVYLEDVSIFRAVADKDLDFARAANEFERLYYAGSRAQRALLSKEGG
jgi:hypothetical protein